MATQQERRDGTRERIVDAARTLFVERGYADTSIADIQERASISRGAIYHHFAAKEDVFEAVFTLTSTDAIRRAAAQAPAGASPREALVAACLGWLSAVDDTATRRILLVDGPAVLGWARARSIEEATSLGAMRSALQRAVHADEIDVPSVDIAAKLINALLAEAALASEPGNRTTRKRVSATVAALLDGLRPR